jgi:hypothetical protein
MNFRGKITDIKIENMDCIVGGIACNCSCRDGWNPGIADSLMECHNVCLRVHPEVTRPSSTSCGGSLYAPCGQSAEINLIGVWSNQGMRNCTRPIGT